MKYLKLKVIQNLNARANCITKKRKRKQSRKKRWKKNLFSSMKYGTCSIFMHKIENVQFLSLKISLNFFFV